MALLFVLQRRRAATVPELARELGISERTAYRDVAALREAGVPVWTETGRHGGVRLVDGWRSHLDGLTSREAAALFAGGVPRVLADLGLGTAVSAAHAKVAATLPAGLREQAEHVARCFHLDAPGWFRREEETEHLASLARAVWAQRRLRITYRRGAEEVERVLEPLGLVLKAGVWYLVARPADAGTPDGDLDDGGGARTYRVARVLGTVELEERFERPAGFDLASWWERSSAQFERSLQRTAVRVRLSPRGLRALPAVLEPDVAAAALAGAGEPDGEGWREVELRLEDPVVAAGQLLALGDGVEVLAPPAARAAFADTARRMADRHR